MPPADQEQATSLRDDFEAAINAVENDDENAITTETAAGEAETRDLAEELERNAESKEAEAQAKTEAEANALLGEADGEPADEKGDAGGRADSSRAEGDGKAATGIEKPPESWTPSAREGWKDIPEPVRQQIVKREQQINKALNEGAENRKAGEKFNGLATEFAEVIAAEGAPDAYTAFRELARTVAQLRMGTPQQRAHKIAGLIQGYGVDINLLDDVLSAQMNGKPAAPDPSDPITQMLNERLKPVDNLLAQMTAAQRERQYQANQEAINEVAQFKQNAEFYADVQNDMADMVEMAERRGYKMPLKEAYEKACALNPEVAKVLQERSEREKLIGQQQEIGAKRRAASSIAGNQSGAPSNDMSELSLRDTLETAFNAQSG